jgi:uroporphyrinogen-III synthase
LAALGAQVDHVSCYRRAKPESGAAGLDEAFRKGQVDAVTVTSSEGLDNLWALCDVATRAAWRRCPTFVPHPRIAARASELGLHVVETAGSDAGLVAGLLEWAAAQCPLKS